MKKQPRIHVAITSYCHEQYIEQCLASAVAQQGDFQLNIYLFDDASTDETRGRMDAFLARTPLRSNVRVISKNGTRRLGMNGNLQRVLEFFQNEPADYCCILEGDDWWASPWRLQRMLELMQNNKECVLAANAFLTYEQETGGYDVDSDQQRQNRKYVGVRRLLYDNFIANFSSSFFRGDAPAMVRREVFDAFTADWIVHVEMARNGKIGYTREPLTIYRKHKQSVWSKRDNEKRARMLFDSMMHYNRLTKYEYADALAAWQNECGRIVNQRAEQHKAEAFSHNYICRPLLSADLIIQDDAFPHPATGFRVEEFETYFEEFDNMRILCTGESMPALGDGDMLPIYRRYTRKHPDYAEKMYPLGMNPPEFIGGKAAYFCFLQNAFSALPWLESRGIPFVFELYPGGGFAMESARSDEQLRMVMQSPCFYKVITTQKVTKEYLLKKGFCGNERIVDVFGVVTPREKLKPYPLKKKRFGFEKDRLDIVFAAFRYTSKGEDKGYDLFVETARRLCHKYNNIYFHVVGGFDEKVLDVKDLGEHITFYGKKPTAWFTQFYVDKDIILSPNMHGLLGKGAFDGFPTASCTEAALCGTAIMCTDTLGMNEGRFDEKTEICIIPHDVDEVVRQVETLYTEPARLAELGQKGAAAVRRIYSAENQMGPRVALLRELLNNADALHRKANEKLRETKEHKSISHIGYIPCQLFYKKEGQDAYEERRKFSSVGVRIDRKIMLEIAARPQASDCEEIRITFYSPKSCLCSVRQLECDGAQLEVFQSNGVYTSEGFTFFSGEKQLFLKSVDQKLFTPKRVFLTLEILDERGPGEVGSLIWRINCDRTNQLEKWKMMQSQSQAELERCQTGLAHYESLPYMKVRHKIGKLFRTGADSAENR